MQQPPDVAHHSILHAQNTTDLHAQIDMEKFAAISGFGGVPSARSNIGRLLAKILSEQETSGDASPAKDIEDGDTIAVTPAGKKGGGRKRKIGEFADELHAVLYGIQD